MDGIETMNRVDGLRVLGITPLIYGLCSCASTDELFAQYDKEFCAVPAGAVQERVVEKQVIRDRVVIKEATAKAVTMPWNPAVYFKSDSADLTLVAENSLLTNVTFLERFVRYRVSLRGFADQHSNSEYNSVLSVSRINSVKEFLVEAGLPADRILSRAHGESLTVQAETSSVADAINRRVEMILLDSSGRPATSYQAVVLGPAE